MGEFSRGLWQWHRTDDRSSSFYYVGAVITRSLSRGSKLTLSQRARQLHWRADRRLAVDRHLQRKAFSFARSRVTNEHQSREDNRPIKLVRSSCQSSLAWRPRRVARRRARLPPAGVLGALERSQTANERRLANRVPTDGNHRLGFAKLMALSRGPLASHQTPSLPDQIDVKTVRSLQVTKIAHPVHLIVTGGGATLAS